LAWIAAPQRNRNDVPRTVVLATPALFGLRISELCALDGDDLDFAGGRMYVPRMRKDRDGQLVRVQGIKTRRPSAWVPMLYDLLIDHKPSSATPLTTLCFATRKAVPAGPGVPSEVNGLRRRCGWGGDAAPKRAWRLGADGLAVVVAAAA
jgi:integrase